MRLPAPLSLGLAVRRHRAMSHNEHKKHSNTVNTKQTEQGKMSLPPQDPDVHMAAEVGRSRVIPKKAAAVHDIASRPLNVSWS